MNNGFILLHSVSGGEMILRIDLIEEVMEVNANEEEAAAYNVGKFTRILYSGRVLECTESVSKVYLEIRKAK